MAFSFHTPSNIGSLKADMALSSVGQDLAQPPTQDISVGREGVKLVGEVAGALAIKGVVDMVAGPTQAQVLSTPPPEVSYSEESGTGAAPQSFTRPSGPSV